MTIFKEKHFGFLKAMFSIVRTMVDATNSSGGSSAVSHLPVVCYCGGNSVSVICVVLVTVVF